MNGLNFQNNNPLNLLWSEVTLDSHVATKSNGINLKIWQKI